jgi:hypothetical protein
MNMPGFTAEASLHEMSKRYRSDGSLQRPLADNQVEPQMRFNLLACLFCGALAQGSGPLGAAAACVFCGLTAPGD